MSDGSISSQSVEWPPRLQALASLLAVPGALSWIVGNPIDGGGERRVIWTAELADGNSITFGGPNAADLLADYLDQRFAALLAPEQPQGVRGPLTIEHAFEGAVVASATCALVEHTLAPIDVGVAQPRVIHSARFRTIFADPNQVPDGAVTGELGLRVVWPRDGEGLEWMHRKTGDWFLVTVQPLNAARLQEVFAQGIPAAPSAETATQGAQTTE